MENHPIEGTQPSNPRRRKRTKFQNFKEAYLPFVLLAAVILVIAGFVIHGFLSRSVPDSKDPGPSTQASTSVLEFEAAALLQDAQKLAQNYDYAGALDLLSSFSGDVKDFPELESAIIQYTAAKNSMVSWLGRDVPNLSFHVLIADLRAALADETYGQKGNNLYNRNFITTSEFSSILNQLYEGGYILVNLSDLYGTAYDSASGQSVYTEKELLLPAGKKPILLTETHCSYYGYMVDSNDDGQPDRNGAGFAYKLKYDGQFYNEMIASDGSTAIGSLDLVPILEDFIAAHPDFSYRGARAILAFSGYDGIFGYRIQSGELEGDELLREQAEAKALAGALREAGYTFANYTYGNINYQLYDADSIQEDLSKWNTEIASVIGATDVMVFAREGDIGSDYENNAKFHILYNAGYRFFLGSSSLLFNQVSDQYVRHNRLMVTGSTLHHFPERFEGMLDPATILDTSRGEIPK